MRKFLKQLFCNHHVWVWDYIKNEHGIIQKHIVVCEKCRKLNPLCSKK